MLAYLRHRFLDRRIGFRRRNHYEKDHKATHININVVTNLIDTGAATNKDN
jgi:hypothetical protein